MLFGFSLTSFTAPTGTPAMRTFWLPFSRVASMKLAWYVFDGPKRNSPNVTTRPNATNSMVTVKMATFTMIERCDS